MKKLISLLLIFAVVWLLTPAFAADPTEETVNCTGSGVLAAWLNSNAHRLPSLISLTLTGEMDDGDMAALSNTRASFQGLETLDMSGATGVDSVPDKFWRHTTGNDALITVRLPDCITTIGERAFSEHPALENIEMSAVETVGEAAFENSMALKSISLPRATKLDTNAFYSCTALTSVSLPAVTQIEQGAFSSCTALETISLPAVTTLGAYVFDNCAALKNISMPAVTQIGYSAFSSCAALKRISLPAVTELGAGAFQACTALTSVLLPQVTQIGEDAFYYAIALQLLYVGGADVVFDIRALEFVPDDALLLYSGSEPTGERLEDRRFYYYPLSLDAKEGDSLTLGETIYSANASLAFTWCKGDHENLSALGGDLQQTLADLTEADSDVYHLAVTIDDGSGDIGIDRLPLVTLIVEGSPNKPENPAQNPENPAQKPENPAQNLESPAHNPVNPAQKPVNPAQNLESPAQKPENPAQNLESPAQKPENPQGGRTAGGEWVEAPKRASSTARTEIPKANPNTGR